MNKIEKALLNSLGDFSNSGKSWKLLTSNSVVKQSLELTEREERIKKALYEIINSNGRFCGGMSFSLKKINSLFIEWDNGKVIEKISVLPTPKELEKVCKSMFLDIIVNTDCVAYPVICINPENALMIFGVSKTVGVYHLAEEKSEEKKATATNTTEEKSEDTTATEESNPTKIANLLTSVVSLAEGMTTSEKLEIVNSLATLLKVDINATAVKVAKIKKSA